MERDGFGLRVAPVHASVQDSSSLFMLGTHLICQSNVGTGLEVTEHLISDVPNFGLAGTYRIQ
jgi:hypothetical protein